VNGLPGDRGLIGNYRAGFWYDDSQFTDFTTVARGFTPRVAPGNWGVYGLFDQVLVRFGEAGSYRGFGITGSVLVSPDQSVSQMPFFSAASFRHGRRTSAASASSTDASALTGKPPSGARSSRIRPSESSGTRPRSS